MNHSQQLEPFLWKRTELICTPNIILNISLEELRKYKYRLHFLPEDYISQNRRRLKHNAIPNVNNK